MELFNPGELSGGPGCFVEALQYLLVPCPQLVASGGASEAMDALCIHRPFLATSTPHRSEDARVHESQTEPEGCLHLLWGVSRVSLKA